MGAWSKGRQGLAVVAAALIASAGISTVSAHADVVWAPNATTIPGSSPDADTAQVASLGGNGDAVAVWDSCGCSTAGVQAAVFDGSNWTGTQTISSPTATDAFGPQVTATSTGHALAVWTELDALGDSSILWSVYGGSWSAPVAISGPDPFDDVPQVAGRPDGTAVAVWVSGDAPSPTVTNIESATFDGSAWTTPGVLSTDGASDVPQVAVTGPGTAAAVWVTGCSCSGTAEGAILTAGTWTPAADLSTPGDDTTEPIVTGTEGGNAVAAWVNVTSPTAVVEARGLDGSGPTGAVETVSDPTQDVVPPAPFAGAAIALTSTGAGHATAVWVGQDTTTGDTTVYGAVRSAAWAPPVALSPALPISDGFNLTPDVTTIDAGVALAIWEQIGPAPVIQAATFDGTNVTGPANISSTGFGGPALPQVAGTGEGTAVSVWTTDDGAISFSIQGALGAPSSVTKPVPGGNATISTSAGGFLHVKNVSVPASPALPAGVTFPYGLFSFDIVNLSSPGASATVTITLPASVSQYWKLQDNAWTQLTNATFAGSHVVFTLTDGGTGDGDHVANGKIIDPSGPGVAVPAPRFTG